MIIEQETCRCPKCVNCRFQATHYILRENQNAEFPGIWTARSEDTDCLQFTDDVRPTDRHHSDPYPGRLLTHFQFEILHNNFRKAESNGFALSSQFGIPHHLVVFAFQFAIESDGLIDFERLSASVPGDELSFIPEWRVSHVNV